MGRVKLICSKNQGLASWFLFGGASINEITDDIKHER
jgi:hypothetical protein